MVELKAIVVEDIKKEIIAFANCEGGKLYIGVQDDGTEKPYYIAKRDCGLKVFMSVRVILLFRLQIRQSVA